jgi:hypothetical protein
VNNDGPVAVDVRSRVTLPLYSGAVSIMDQVKRVYRGNGYTVEKDFPDEYYFMHNPDTGERVRLYYSGKVDEYRLWQ